MTLHGHWSTPIFDPCQLFLMCNGFKFLVDSFWLTLMDSYQLAVMLIFDPNGVLSVMLIFDPNGVLSAGSDDYFWPWWTLISRQWWLFLTLMDSYQLAVMIIFDPGWPLFVDPGKKVHPDGQILIGLKFKFCLEII